MADLFARGFRPGTCPPPIYGLGGALTSTADPHLARARIQLSLDRCQLGPSSSTDFEPSHAELKPNDRPDLPTGPSVKSQSSSGKSDSEAMTEAAPPLLDAVQPCPPKTLCLGRPGSGRADLLVRDVELLDSTHALAFLTLSTDEIEVWRRLEGQADADAVSWLFPALTGAKTANSGLLDAWDTSETDFAARRAQRKAVGDALAPGAEGEVSPRAAPAAPKPPYATWVTSPLIPGFRFQARFGAWIGQAGPAPGVGSTACLAQTACLGRSASQPAGLFIRLLAGKKGALSPILAKFALEPVEVWIEQTAKRRVRYYRLDGTLPGLVELDGLFDRDGFPK